jgi:hypothetical protein
MESYLEQINELIPIHRKVAWVNPAIHAMYPVVIAEGEQLFIYDHDASLACYQFIKHIPAPMPIPKGVRAAFQLRDYGGRIVCVVTPDIFDASDGFVTILHEFVHCYQYETCEQELKLRLDVARQASEKGDFMWEIQHPFPYDARAFTQGYADFFAAVLRADQPAIQGARGALRAYLGLHDYEYMVWQEWKEGFARWVENRVRPALGFPERTSGLEVPYSRKTFYAGGAAYIDYLHQQDSSVVNDLQRLFARMLG